MISRELSKPSPAFYLNIYIVRFHSVHKQWTAAVIYKHQPSVFSSPKHTVTSRDVTSRDGPTCSEPTTGYKAVTSSVNTISEMLLVLQVTYRNKHKADFLARCIIHPKRITYFLFICDFIKLIVAAILIVKMLCVKAWYVLINVHIRCRKQ